MTLSLWPSVGVRPDSDLVSQHASISMFRRYLFETKLQCRQPSEGCAQSKSFGVRPSARPTKLEGATMASGPKIERWKVSMSGWERVFAVLVVSVLLLVGLTPLVER